MSQMWQKPIRNFSDLKIVITTGGSTPCKGDITKNLSEIFRTWKMSRMRHHKKPIRIFSDLKNVTNAASQKTYPKFFGLEKCHECSITKDLSEFFRTWKMSRMSANLTQLVGLELCHGWVRLIFVPQKNLSIA